MTDAETKIVFYINWARDCIKYSPRFEPESVNFEIAADKLTKAFSHANRLPADLKAKHRGAIMARLNKVRALARRAAA